MIRRLAVVAAVAALAACTEPPPARALNVAKPVCTLGGLVSGVVGKVCSAASHGAALLKAGQKLLGGHLGGAVEALSGTAAKAVGLAAALAWVAAGASVALHETSAVISSTTRPQLESTWFSSYYWRMAAIGGLLTLPFVFAACVQAMMRSDLAMLARSVLLYLPMGVIAIGIATPITLVLLSAADELSALISSVSGGADASFLGHAGLIAGLLSVGSHSAFLGFFIALLTVAATVTLWVELLIRSAAVYVIVLMLPLVFAALVWPGRRVWAARSVELLVAVILSKFAIVAVLSLGGAALGHTTIPGLAGELQGATLILLAAFSPWALMRLLPLHELAGGLDGLRMRAQPGLTALARADGATEIAHEVVRQLPTGTGEYERAATEQPRGATATVQALEQERAQQGGSPAQPPTDDDPR